MTLGTSIREEIHLFPKSGIELGLICEAFQAKEGAGLERLCLPGGVQWLLVATVIWAGVTCAGISRQQAGPSHSPASQSHFPRQHPPFAKEQIHVPSNCCVCRAAGEKWPRQMSLFTPGCNNLVTQRGLQRVIPYKTGL